MISQKSVILRGCFKKKRDRKKKVMWAAATIIINIIGVNNIHNTTINIITNTNARVNASGIIINIIIIAIINIGVNVINNINAIINVNIISNNIDVTNINNINPTIIVNIFTIQRIQITFTGSHVPPGRWYVPPVGGYSRTYQ